MLLPSPPNSLLPPILPAIPARSSTDCCHALNLLLSYVLVYCEVTFPSTFTESHSSPCPPHPLYSSSPFFFFPPAFWGLLDLAVPYACFRGKHARGDNPYMHNCLSGFKCLGLWGNQEDSPEVCVYKSSSGSCLALRGYTLKYLQCFHAALMPSAQERLCSAEDLRLWQTSSGKAPWSGLRCYYQRLCTLPLHWSLQAPDISTERACTTAAQAVWLVP